jgi:hypothetical protein
MAVQLPLHRRVELTVRNNLGQALRAVIRASDLSALQVEAIEAGEIASGGEGCLPVTAIATSDRPLVMELALKAAADGTRTLASVRFGAEVVAASVPRAVVPPPVVAGALWATAIAMVLVGSEGSVEWVRLLGAFLAGVAMWPILAAVGLLPVVTERK